VSFCVIINHYRMDDSLGDDVMHWSKHHRSTPAPPPTLPKTLSSISRIPTLPSLRATGNRSTKRWSSAAAGFRTRASAGAARSTRSSAPRISQKAAPPPAAANFRTVVAQTRFVQKMICEVENTEIRRQKVRCYGNTWCCHVVLLPW